MSCVLVQLSRVKGVPAQIAGALKLWLACLPDPAVPPYLLTCLLRLNRIEGTERRMAAAQYLISQVLWTRLCPTRPCLHPCLHQEAMLTRGQITALMRCGRLQLFKFELGGGAANGLNQLSIPAIVQGLSGITCDETLRNSRGHAVSGKLHE